MTTRDELCSQLLNGITTRARQAETDLALGRTVRIPVAELLSGIKVIRLELDQLLSHIESDLAEAALQAKSGWSDGFRESGTMTVDVRSQD